LHNQAAGLGARPPAGVWQAHRLCLRRSTAPSTSRSPCGRSRGSEDAASLAGELA